MSLVGLRSLQSQLIYFYEASLLVETVTTSAVDVFTVGGSKLLKQLFDLDRPITRRDVLTGKKRHPGS